MAVIAGSKEDGTIGSQFGRIPKSLVEEVDYTALRDLAAKVVFGLEIPKDQTLEAIERYRTGVGALWIKLGRDLDGSIEQAHRVVASLWKCMWASMISRRFNPQKFRKLCGIPTEGYGHLVTVLANAPHQDELCKRWGLTSWAAYVNVLWRTKNGLMEKEKQYRDLAVAIAQIGVGLGGMLVGLAGVVLSVIVPVVMPPINNLIGSNAPVHVPPSSAPATPSSAPATPSSAPATP